MIPEIYKKFLQGQSALGVNSTLTPSCPASGIGAVRAFVESLGVDALWLKYRNNSVWKLLRRNGDGWTLHHTDCITETISKARGWEGLDGFNHSDNRHISLRYEEEGVEAAYRLSHQFEDGVTWTPAAPDANIPLKKCIPVTNRLSCEKDDVASADEQLGVYRWFESVSGLKFSYLLTSGSKSIHAHIDADRAYPYEQMEPLRRLFVLVCLGDPAVTNRHQAMRAPGFFRKNKGQHQELLEIGRDRYSIEEIEEGLKRAFVAKDWKYPDTLTKELWGALILDVKAKIAPKSNVFKPAAERSRLIRKHLEKGVEPVVKRPSKFDSLSGGNSLMDALNEAKRNLDWNAQFPGITETLDGHTRVVCPWHNGSNSAYVNESDGVPLFHCPTCTSNKGVDALQFAVSDPYGELRPYPSGSDWAKAAKDFLSANGIAISSEKLDDLQAAFGEYLPPVATIRYKDSSNNESWLRDGITPAQQAKARNPGYFALTSPVELQTSPHIELPDMRAGEILVADGGLGVGKTYQFVELKKKFFKDHPDGCFDVLSYRNTLARQTAKRMGSDFIHQLVVPGCPGLNAGLIDESQSVTLCLDSLGKRIGVLLRVIEGGKKVCIVIDELDAVIKHLIGGGTLKGRQSGIWLMLGNLLTQVARSGGCILAGEANVSELSLVALKGLAGGAEHRTIKNTFNVNEGRQVFDYRVPSKKGVHFDGHLLKAAFSRTWELLKDGAVCFISDAQKVLEKIEWVAVAQGKKVLRIDATTVDNGDVQEFLENPKAYLETHCVDLLLISPSAESGLSVEGDFFKNVVLYGSHLEARAIYQMSGRVRGMAPLHTFIKNRGGNFTDQPDSWSASGVLKTWQKNLSDAAIASELANFCDADILRSADERLALGPGAAFNLLAAHYRARANISRSMLHEEVIRALINSGAVVATVTKSLSEEGNTLYTSATEAIDDREAHEYIAVDPNQSIEWARECMRSPSTRKEDRLKALKIIDCHNFPTLRDKFNAYAFVLEEIVKKKRRNLKENAGAWLIKHEKIAQIQDLRALKSQVNQHFPVLATVKAESAKVKVLASSCLLELAALDGYAENTTQVVALAQWAQERRDLLGRLFRIFVKPDQTNIHIVNKLLRKAGFVGKAIKQQGPRGKRERVYAATPLPNQEIIWAALGVRWEKELAEEIEIEGFSNPVHTIRYKDSSNNESCAREDIPRLLSGNVPPAFRVKPFGHGRPAASRPEVVFAEYLTA